MSPTALSPSLSSVRSVGGIMPADMLLRIFDGRDVEGGRPADYGIVGARSVEDEAERLWQELRGAWWVLRRTLPGRDEDGRLPGDPTRSAVRGWIEPLFVALGFGRLAGLRISGIAADDDPGRIFPMTHRYQRLLITVVPWEAELDARGRDGSASAQSQMQEALNRSRAHLWGLVTNGREVRLLRDSTSLAGAAYLSLDLETVFDGEQVHEFIALWRLLHASRFEVPEGEPPSVCLMERWRDEASRSGVRALDALRKNVEEALAILGTGFLRHPDNHHLRRSANAEDLHRALLRLVFRLLFLAVVEERGLLHPPHTGELTRGRYADYFSFARLRRVADAGAGGGQHRDLHTALRMVLDSLGREEGRPELGLAGLGGLFTRTEEDRCLDEASLSNQDLLRAIRRLSRVQDAATRRRRPVSFRSLSARELGAVYESLLEALPEHRPDTRTFGLVHRAGNARKMTGSYYTPSSLISRLLDTCLEPVLDEAVKEGADRAAEHPELDEADTIAEILLSVTVCDPACGSGHFLVAAGQRIAKRVAAVREGTPEPSEEGYRQALHTVIARCLYGVDINHMALDVAKMALWLEGMTPGSPLDLLDPHLKCGNALIGATPAQMRGGVPDAAFTPVEGDDRKTAAALTRTNALERAGQDALFDAEPDRVKMDNTAYAEGLHGLYAIEVGSLRDVRDQEQVYRVWRGSADYRRALHIADAWCAAFLWEKTGEAPPPVTDETFRRLFDPEDAAAAEATHTEIRRLRDQYRFFHWHLEFPDIFRVCDDPADGRSSAPGWQGGFDCVLSNPPWDKLDFEDKKYFSVAQPSLARLAGMARREAIVQWQRDHPQEAQRYRSARRQVKSTLHFAGRSDGFPACAEGLAVKGVNTLQVDHLFVELFTGLIKPEGRIGAIVPTSIATGAGAQELFATLTRERSLASLYDFENLKQLFPGVDARQRFSLLSLHGPKAPAPVADFAFFLHEPVDLDDAHRAFELTAEEISLLNPNTGSLPLFRSSRDADLTLDVYRRVPVLWEQGLRDTNPWAVRFKNLYNMTDDSGLFRTRAELEKEGWELRGNVFERDGKMMSPLYEAKMAHHFDHRWNGFTPAGVARQPDQSEKEDHGYGPLPRYWVPEDDGASEGLATRLSRAGWDRGWLYGWRDVTNVSNERTAIPALLPRAAVGHTFPLMFVRKSARLVAALCAVQSSLVFDFIARQKINGAHMSLMTWKQLPVPTPGQLEPHLGFLVPRVLELAYTSHDMAPLARDLGCTGPPYPWDEERRAVLRAELDAFCFRLYGIGRQDAEYVLETFQTEKGGLKNNEIDRFGTYRTKALVLEAFDRLP